MEVGGVGPMISPPCPPNLSDVVCGSGLGMENKVKSQNREPLFPYATLIPGGQGDKARAISMPWLL